jgi:hypothetical protein
MAVVSINVMFLGALGIIKLLVGLREKYNPAIV